MLTAKLIISCFVWPYKPDLLIAVQAQKNSLCRIEGNLFWVDKAWFLSFPFLPTPSPPVLGFWFITYTGQPLLCCSQKQILDWWGCTHYNAHHYTTWHTCAYTVHAQTHALHMCAHSTGKAHKWDDTVRTHTAYMIGDCNRTTKCTTHSTSPIHPASRWSVHPPHPLSPMQMQW